MNSNIDFQSVCFKTILFSSIEVINFSSQLYFFLANIKSEIWHLYVCDVIIVKVRGEIPTPLLIFSYKGMFPLYYSMGETLNIHKIIFDLQIYSLTIQIHTYKQFSVFLLQFTIKAFPLSLHICLSISNFCPAKSLQVTGYIWLKFS